MNGAARFRSDRARRAWLWVGLPLAVYVLAALIVTWPLVTRLDTHAAGAGYGDSYEVIRHVWWAREALLDGHNPFDQPLLAYPDGFTSWVQWSHPLQIMPPTLLALVLSPLAAFNVMLLIVLVLNGLAAYWLGMHLNGREPLGALLGGLALLAYPAVQGHLSVGHLGIMSLWPVPLFLLCVWRILAENAGWRAALWGGVWLALAMLAYVSQAIYVIAPLLGFGALALLIRGRDHLAQPGQPWQAQPWLRLVAMLALGGVLILPFYLPLLGDEGRAELRDVAESGRVAFSADLLGPVSPSPFGPLDDLGLAPDYARDVLGVNSAEGTAYVGLVAALLAGVAVTRRRAARFWLVIGLGALVLSFGPLLKWRDQPLTFRVEDLSSYVALPWALLQQLPGLDSTRTPGRFNLATGLAISALVSVGAGMILARRRGWVRVALAVVLGAVMLAEYQLFTPFPTDDARQPDYFAQLAREDDVRAVLNVPVNHNLVAKFALYQQTIHGKALIAGHALRRTPQDPAVLAVLGQIATGESPLGTHPLDPALARFVLAAAGADRVILHKDFVPDPGAATDYLNALLGPPVFEDARIAAYLVPRAEDGAPSAVLVHTPGGDGWSAPVPVGGEAVSFLAGEGAWYLYAPTEAYGDFVLDIAPYRVQRPLRAWLDGHLIAGWWGGVGEWRLPLRLETGFHTLRFAAEDGCTDYPFALTCFDSDPLAGDCAPIDPPVCISSAFGAPRWEPASMLPQAAGIDLEHGMNLDAYAVTLTPDHGAVQVRLFWAADKRLPDSYALFVHVSDPATDIPAVDPPFSQYPLVLTGAWGPGTRWTSDVTIDLPPDLPAGEYAINVGWFRESDGARLARLDGGGDIIRLGTITVEAAREVGE